MELVTPLTEVKIVLNDFKRLWADVESDVLASVKTVGESGWYILGSQVRDFESQLAQFWGHSYGIGTGNGLDAIEIGLRALGLQPGEKVLTTPLSAFATTLAIIRAGGKPYFVDVDPSGLMDLEQAEALLQKEAIRFLVPVHLYGHALSLSTLETLKNRYHLSIVEDCAQAIGATHEERMVGTVGQVAATSFYPTKNLGAFGDGGAALTSDPNLATLLQSLRDYGQTQKYVHEHLGLNSRLDEVQAAILKEVLLPKLPQWTKKRQEIAKAYCEGIHHPHLKIPTPLDTHGSVWHLFPIRVPQDKRQRFMDALRGRGILTAIHYPALIPDQPAFLKAFPGEASIDTTLKFPQAKRFTKEVVSLPIHPYLSDDEVSQVIEACHSWDTL